MLQRQTGGGLIEQLAPKLLLARDRVLQRMRQQGQLRVNNIRLPRTALGDAAHPWLAQLMPVMRRSTVMILNKLMLVSVNRFNNCCQPTCLKPVPSW